MSFTFEELNALMLGADALDTTRDAGGNYPEKLGDLLAEINGVTEEKLLADLGPPIGKEAAAERSDIVVPAKYGKRGPLDIDRPVIRPAKTAGEIVDEAMFPQLALARLLDEYIRLVIREELGESGTGAEATAVGDTGAV